MLKSYSNHQYQRELSRVRSYQCLIYVYFFVYMIVLTHEGLHVSSFHRLLMMSTSTSKQSSIPNDKFTRSSSSSSSSEVSSKETNFMNFKGKKLGMEGVQDMKQQNKMNKLKKGKIQPRDFEPKYITHAADDRFDDQLTSLNKKSNELLTDLKNVYLKLRVLTEVIAFL